VRRRWQRIGTTNCTALAVAVRDGYRLALARSPTEKELALAGAFLEQQIASYHDEGRVNARPTALADFCQILMGVNEFIYID
jgi:hypothetical protein